MNTIKSEQKPSSIQLLGNNTYYYNYDIKPCKITKYDEVTHKESIIDGWEYLPVYIQGNPSYAECVKNVIRKFIPLDDEFDLINSYNRALMTNTVDARATDNYTKYLQLVAYIKDKTKEVFNNLNK